MGNYGGLIINGVAGEGGRAGYSVAGIGDVNGDGFPDLAIGAPEAPRFYDYSNDPDNVYAAAEGAVYVVFGSAAGLPTEIDLEALDGSNGFKIEAENDLLQSQGFNLFALREQADFGFDVIGLGDVNGDAIDDFAIAQRGTTEGGLGGSFGGGGYFGEGGYYGYDLAQGVVYVIHGGQQPYGAVENVADLAGFRIDTEGGVTSLVAVGDINGDMLADVGVNTAEAATDTRYYDFYYLYDFNENGVYDQGLVQNPGSGYDGFEFYYTGQVSYAVGRTDVFVIFGSDQERVSDEPIAGSGGGGGTDPIVVLAQAAAGSGASGDTVVNTTLLDGGDGFQAQTGETLSEGTNYYSYYFFPGSLYDQSLGGGSAVSFGDINGDGLADLIWSAGGYDVDNDFDAGAGFRRVGSPSGTSYAPEQSPFSETGLGSFVLLGQAEAFPAFIGLDQNNPIIDAVLFGTLSQLDPFGDDSLFSTPGSRVPVTATGNFVAGDANADFAFPAFAQGTDPGNDNSFIAELDGLGFTEGVFLLSGAEAQNADGSFFDQLAISSNPLVRDTTAADIVAGAGTFFYDSLNAEDIERIRPFSVGDVNADGIDDLLITARFSGNSEVAYLVFGKDGGFPDPVFDLASLEATGVAAADRMGFRIDGIIDRSVFASFVNPTNFGRDADGLTDVNGDGFGDLVIGADYADGGNYRDGKALVIFGGPDALSAVDAADGSEDGVLSTENLGVDIETGVVPIEVSLLNAGFFASSVSEGDPGDPGVPRLLSFTLVRTGDLTAGVEVDFAVTPDAFNPVDAADFVGGALPSGTVAFAAGSPTATIEIPVSPDLAIEASERLVVTVSNPTTDSGAPISLDGGTSAFGIISNDDFPVFLRASAGGAFEGDVPGEEGTLVFAVSRSGETGVPVSVDVTLSSLGLSDPARASDIASITVDGVPVALPGDPDAQDFVTTTLSFDATDTVKQILVETDPDTVIEPGERLQLSIIGADAGGTDVEITQTSAIASIVNDDLPARLSVTNSGSVEEGGTLIYTISRRDDLESTVSVDFDLGPSTFRPASSGDLGAVTLVEPGIGNTALGSGFLSGAVTFLPGESVKQLLVETVEDAAVEHDERARLTLSNPTSPDAQQVVFDNTATDGTILNDDFEPEIFASAIEGVRTNAFASTAEGDPNDPNVPRTITFFVNRRGTDEGEVTVDFEVRQGDFGVRTADGLDIDSVSGAAPTPIQSLPFVGQVTLPDGVDSVPVTVDISPDFAPEPNERFVFEITGVDDSLAPAPYTVIQPAVTGEIRNDDGLPPNFLELGLEADIFGDPHLVTLDGLGYDFQATGEYILVESADQTAADAFQVQVRFEPLPGSDLVSVTTRANVTIGGELVEIDAFGDVPLIVNGTPTAIDEVTGPLDVDGDGLADVFLDPATMMYTIVVSRDANGDPARGLSIKVNEGSGGFLNVCVFLSPSDAGAVRGLLGDADGDLLNDFRLRDGTVPTADEVDTSGAAPVPSFDFLYGAYRDSWRLSEAGSGADNESLFTFGAGETSDGFFDASFPQAALSVDDLPADLVARAEAAADEAGITDPVLREAAILDFALTGDEDFTAGAAGIAADPQAEAEPSGAPEATTFVTISADEPEVVEGDGGTRTIGYTIARGGDTDVEFELDLSLGGTFGADDGVALGASMVFFEAGQTEAQVAVSFTGDEENEDDELVTVSIGTDEAGVLVAGSIATTRILTDDTPPVAVDDLFATAADAPVVDGDLVEANGVDADGDGTDDADSDAEADPFTVVRVIDRDGVPTAVPASGTTQIVLPSGALLTIAATGVFTYDPTGAASAVTEAEALADGALGMDGFSYTIADAQGDESTADVEVALTGVDDAPLVASVTATFSEGETGREVDLLAGAADPEGADLDVTGVAITPATFEGTPIGSLVSVDGETGLLTIADGAFDSLGATDLLIEVSYEVTDGGLSTPNTAAITIEGENDAPVITSPDTVEVVENTTAVLTVTATDADAGDVPTFAIVGGEDGGAFSIDGTTGVLSFDVAPDFEVPGSANGDNVYEVEVQATDGLDPVTQTILVTVTDDPDDDVTGPIVLEGTPGNDRVFGSPEPEIIRTFGGALDYAAGGGGADVFEFDGPNGIRETELILDFDGDDKLDLGTSWINREINVGDRTYLFTGLDNDLIVLNGVSDFDEMTQLVDSSFFN